MRDRHPGSVPDDVAADPDVPDHPMDVGRGVDTDGDGRADTVLWADGADLLVASDLDGDGFADRLRRIGPDGAVHADDPAAYHPGGPVPGSAPATHGPWMDLLGWLDP